MGNKRDSTKRFADRVENYVKYRPHYPAEIIDLLKEEVKLTPNARIADIGSGTGISSELFLKNGNIVTGVEPNKEMREAAEKLLADYPNFESKDGKAEATGLATQSVDFVVAGQAFHWFDPAVARTEFARIMRPGAYAIIMWNVRLIDATPFLVAYEAILNRFGTDYNEVKHQIISESANQEGDNEAIATFFAPQEYKVKVIPNYQIFDFVGVKGRLLSSSYAPAENQPGHDEMLAALESIFNEHQVDGKVTFAYKTRIFWGRLV